MAEREYDVGLEEIVERRAKAIQKVCQYIQKILSQRGEERLLETEFALMNFSVTFTQVVENYRALLEAGLAAIVSVRGYECPQGFDICPGNMMIVTKTSVVCPSYDLEIPLGVAVDIWPDLLKIAESLTGEYVVTPPAKAEKIEELYTRVEQEFVRAISGEAVDVEKALKLYDLMVKLRKEYGREHAKKL